jgi:hypothetical protein
VKSSGIEWNGTEWSGIEWYRTECSGAIGFKRQTSEGFKLDRFVTLKRALANRLLAKFQAHVLEITAMHMRCSAPDSPKTCDSSPKATTSYEKSVINLENLCKGPTLPQASKENIATNSSLWGCWTPESIVPCNCSYQLRQPSKN